MIGDLKPYAEYKDSGSRWLGNIPAHWEARNLRTLIRSRNERNRPDLPLLSVAREKGVFVRSLTDTSENHNVIPEDLSNYKVARSGSLVINKMKAWQGSMGIAPVDGLVSPAYFVYDFAISNRDYGQALLRSKPYVAHFGQASDGVRVGQWDLTITGMRAIPVLVPPPDEQAAIVRFLEWANARLERAIRAKRKVIALLNEQKQAIIHLAVTRGLDPSVPLKPSGIPWLGDIPGHWEMVRAKALFRQVATPVPVDAEQVTCFRDGQVTLRRNRRTTGFTNAIFELGYQGIHPGQLCLHSMDAFAGAIGVADSSGKCSPEYVICEPALAKTCCVPGALAKALAKTPAKLAGTAREDAKDEHDLADAGHLAATHQCGSGFTTAMRGGRGLLRRGRRSVVATSQGQPTGGGCQRPRRPRRSDLSRRSQEAREPRRDGLQRAEPARQGLRARPGRIHRFGQRLQSLCVTTRRGGHSYYGI
ncbi:MAG: hypothetical protein JNM38_25395 [Acidobacteria bacterium]|nr:hypothetical protein [Acidobacteriota bacterium]